MGTKRESSSKFTTAEIRLVSTLVDHYVANQEKLQIVLDALNSYLSGSSALRRHVHSIKYRLKDPEHLRDKLFRKTRVAKLEGTKLDITKDTLFARINDLVGFRVLHLYTEQIRDIDGSLKSIFMDGSYKVLEGPIAKTWDDESRAFFQTIGIATEESHLYTSVHYVIETASKTPYTCEIQVRTLMEEVWGEVDHKINYPHHTEHLSCREQLAALARVTSGCTRLVDSIFRSFDDLRQEHVAVSRGSGRNKALGMKKKDPS
jgi:ppGpp synthetase/RelA/SpoT-type nucleotidyltranferase